MLERLAVKATSEKLEDATVIHVYHGMTGHNGVCAVQIVVKAFVLVPEHVRMVMLDQLAAKDLLAKKTHALLGTVPFGLRGDNGPPAPDLVVVGYTPGHENVSMALLGTKGALEKS